MSKPEGWCPRCEKFHLDQLDFAIACYIGAKASDHKDHRLKITPEQMRKHGITEQQIEARAKKAKAARIQGCREAVIRAAFREAGVPGALPERYHYHDEQSMARYLGGDPCPG